MRILAFIFFLLAFYCADAQNNSESEHLEFYINETVKNANESYAKDIINLWQTYLLSNDFAQDDSEYWDYSEYAYPDYAYISLLLDIVDYRNSRKILQCNVIGLTEVQEEIFLLKSMFSEVSDSTDQVSLKYIVSVYCVKINGEFKFISSPHYFKTYVNNEQVGSINYLIHPQHKFDRVEAERMDSFNIHIADFFDIEPLNFDYIVANNTDDLSLILGYE